VASLAGVQATKAGADQFAANVLPVIDQIEATGSTSLRDSQPAKPAWFQNRTWWGMVCGYGQEYFGAKRLNRYYF
jgi:hypothetical protein